MAEASFRSRRARRCSAACLREALAAPESDCSASVRAARGSRRRCSWCTASASIACWAICAGQRRSSTRRAHADAASVKRFCRRASRAKARSAWTRVSQSTTRESGRRHHARLPGIGRALQTCRSRVACTGLRAPPRTLVESAQTKRFPAGGGTAGALLQEVRGARRQKGQRDQNPAGCARTPARAGARRRCGRNESSASGSRSREHHSRARARAAFPRGASACSSMKNQRPRRRRRATAAAPGAACPRAAGRRRACRGDAGCSGSRGAADRRSCRCRSPPCRTQPPCGRRRSTRPVRPQSSTETTGAL